LGPVISFRIYREAFAPALLAVVVLLFSLQGRPDALPPVVASAEFDQDAAARIDRQIVDAAPVRPPGSDGDLAIADMVEKRFTSVSEGQVAQQRFAGSFEGNDVQLRNLILTLPGESPRSVVVVAARDSATGPGAASSAAATAALLELVDKLRTARHTKTLVFVSTDGGSAGAAGAREFAERFAQRNLIDGAVVLWQPGSATPREPSLLDASDGPQSPSAQLVRTAQRTLNEQTGRRPQLEGVFGELARLALPSGLGEQAVLIAHGIDAVGLSSAGERPLPAADDQPDDFSAATLGGLGRTALILVATLDGTTAPPEHGPAAYLNLAGDLVPGWALALLALTLLLPAALVSLDSLRQAFVRRARVDWALAWSASRALPLLAAVAILYLLAVTGIIARPAFPFDPNRFQVGAGQIVAMAFLAIVILAGYYAIRGWRVPAGLPGEVAAPALGLVAAFAVLIAWLANPYLALLLVPVAHVWLLDARRGGTLPWPLALGAIALSLAPAAAALVHVAGRLDTGSGAPWQLLLMVGDGQIGFPSMLALCLLAGSLVGLVALAIRPASAAPAARLAARGWAALPVGPDREPTGALSGDDLDASPIAPRGANDDLADES
jgi:peptidase M28-like protein